jgi:hypothetical protein
MRRVVQFVAGLVIATSALANDSGASIAPGGLVLQRDEATDPPSRHRRNRRPRLNPRPVPATGWSRSIAFRAATFAISN